MKKYLLSAAALVLFGTGAEAATVYVLNNVAYTNTFGSAPIVCNGCGTGTATDDGFGNISLSGISFTAAVGTAQYAVTLAGSTTLAVGTTLNSSGGSCTYLGGSDICDPAAIRWGLGQSVFYTGLGSDGSTVCQNDRCRVDLLLSGSTLTMELKRALSESNTSSAYGKWAFTFAAVPVPGAVWLFGSALGLIGLARRKAA